MVKTEAEEVEISPLLAPIRPTGQAPKTLDPTFHIVQLNSVLSTPYNQCLLNSTAQVCNVDFP